MEGPRWAFVVTRGSSFPGNSRGPGIAPPWAFLVGAIVCFSLGGCAGYQVGPRALFRPEIRTVRVPIFTSDTYRRGLAEWLTEAVVKEIERESTYKVVSHGDADSVLSGTLVSERKRVQAENAFDDPRVLEADLEVQVNWIDRQGRVLMPAVNLPLPAFALNIGHAAAYVPEAGQSPVSAQQNAIRQIARQVVSQMEQPW